MNEIILHATDRTDTRITRTSFKGVERVDIRLFVDVEGERRPTKKGVSIPLARLPELIAALHTLDQRERALLAESPAPGSGRESEPEG